MVKKVAEEHGGTVHVTSSSEGTTFVLRLPQKGPGAIDASAQSPSRPGGSSPAQTSSQGAV